jgi:3-hydroxyisobutyrate dehydrogenase
MTSIAVLGTGIMGAPMARNLAGAGFDVRAWNRSREKAAPLAEHGVTVADTPADAVAGCSIVVTMLADADVTADVAEQFLPAMEEDTVWDQMATLGIRGIERAGAMAGKRGVAFVDAPVLGTRQPAEAGALIVLAAGEDGPVERCGPVFDAVGGRTIRVGAEPGLATKLKLALNNWVLAVTEATAETVALAQGLGVDPQLLTDALDGGPLDLQYFRAKAKLMLALEFPPSFSLTLAAKDARLVVEAAEEAGVDAPVARAVAQRFGEAAAAGHGDEDMSATFRLAVPAAG